MITHLRRAVVALLVALTLAIASRAAHTQDQDQAAPLSLRADGSLAGGFTEVRSAEVPVNPAPVKSRIDTGLREDRIWQIYITVGELPQGAGWAAQSPELLAKHWSAIAGRPIGWGGGSSVAHGPMVIFYRVATLAGAARPNCLFATGTAAARWRLDVRVCSRTALHVTAAPEFLRAIGHARLGLQPFAFTPPPAPPDSAPLPAPIASDVPAIRAEPDRLNRAIDLGVVQVLALRGGNRLTQGGGVVVAPGRVMTARHVIDGAQKLLVASRSQRFIRPATLLATDDEPGSDMALLSVEAPELEPLPLAAAQRLGNVLAAGFPASVLKAANGNRGIDVTRPDRLPATALRGGEIMAVQTDGDGIEIVAHSTAIEQGNSGGPLLDRCGRITGINQRIVINGQTRTQTAIALSAREMARFLAANGLNLPVTGAVCP